MDLVGEERNSEHVYDAAHSTVVRISRVAPDLRIRLIHTLTKDKSRANLGQAIVIDASPTVSLERANVRTVMTRYRLML